MARDLSIVVFGASGFTGAYIVAELLKSKLDSSEYGRFGIAGRSLSKLRNVSDSLDAGERLAILPNVDVADHDSMMLLARSCRLIINAVGPFRLYGEAVVRACVECGTDYLDICGEPEFMERMALRYNQRAEEANCYVASAAAFDSVPADFGCILAQRLFQPPAVPSSVTAYLKISAPLGYSIHYATWQSAVLGFGSVAELRSLRMEARGAAGALEAVRPAGPRLKHSAGAAYCSHPQVGAWSMPFPGADASVVRRSQAEMAAAGEPTVHFAARFTVPNLYYVIMTVAVGAVMQLLAGSAWGRSLLLKFPRLFSAGSVSHQGPSLAQIDAASATSTLVVQGYSKAPLQGSKEAPDLEAVLRITMPDPGYKGTAILVVTAALTVLQERDALGEPGVHTAGALLRNTTYAQRLQAAGVTIQTVTSPAAPARKRPLPRRSSQP